MPYINVLRTFEPFKCKSIVRHTDSSKNNLLVLNYKKRRQFFCYILGFMFLAFNSIDIRPYQLKLPQTLQPIKLQSVLGNSSTADYIDYKSVFTLVVFLIVVCDCSQNCPEGERNFFRLMVNFNDQLKIQVLSLRNRTRQSSIE